MKFKIIGFTLFIGCVMASQSCSEYGIVGKQTIAGVNRSVDTLSRDINSLKRDIINYLNNDLDQTLRKSVVSMLNGVIESLGNPENRKGLDSLIGGLINTAGGDARRQLLAFQNGLLNPYFVNQLRITLRDIMNEVVVTPTTRLLDSVTGDNTRNHLDKLLRMIVPALLNDSAIGQINTVRSALLGPPMQKDLAGLIDTALGTVNARLGSGTSLKQNIHEMVTQNVDTIGQKAINIFIIIGVIVLALGLVFYYLHARLLKKKNDMLFTVSNSIEEFRKMDKTKDQEHFHELTATIHDNMVKAQLEEDMKKFLIQKNINKPSDYN